MGSGRALRRYRKSVADYRRVLEPWQEEADALRSHLTVATTFAGASAADEPSVPVGLEPGERVFSVLERVALVEPRRLPDRWATGYTGFSFRLARGVRYPAETGKGNAPNEDVPAALDAGAAIVTDRRVAFRGAKGARQWRYEALHGYHHDGRVPVTLFHVADQQKVSGLLYERGQAEELHARLAMALAHYSGHLPELISHLERQLAAHDAIRPQPPKMPAVARSALPSSRQRPRLR